MIEKAYQVYKEYVDGGEQTWTLYGKTREGIVVVGIDYHEALFVDGDAHYCDIKMSDGTRTRVFRPTIVEFRRVKEDE